MTISMKTFIKNNWKRIILGAAVILALLLFPWNCDNQDIANQSKDVSDKKIDLSQVQIWKDKYNNEHYKLERLQVDKSVLQVHADSLAKLLKIKPKQVQSYTHIKSGVSLDQKLKSEIKYDTIWEDGFKTVIEYRPFSYNDKWIDIKGDIGKSDSIHIKGTDTLTKVNYWKRKWFLGTKHYYSDFSNSNPYIKIEGLKQVEVKQTKSRWGIGPSIQMSARLGTPIEFIPTIGLSLQYNLIRF